MQLYKNCGKKEYRYISQNTCKNILKCIEMVSKQGNVQFKSNICHVEASKSGLKIINVMKKKCDKIPTNVIFSSFFFFRVIITLIKISPSKDRYPLHHFLRYNLLHFSSFSFSSLINPYFTRSP